MAKGNHDQDCNTRKGFRKLRGTTCRGLEGGLERVATRERQGTKIPITPHIRENCLEGFRGSGVKHDQACRGRRAITIRIAEFERGNRNQDCTMNAYPVPQPRTSHSVWWCGPPPHGLHVLPMVRRDLDRNHNQDCRGLQASKRRSQSGSRTRQSQSGLQA